ncbi:MAG TPA: TonB-dependent receptor plug domain-containing protein, partial [bacterium]
MKLKTERCRYFLFLAIFLCGCWQGNIKRSGNDRIHDLAVIPIEDLMDIEFITVGKKTEKLFESAAAAAVITQEDIRKTGVITIPDALRMVPGMQVVQHNASSWAITVRGFSGFSRAINGQFANKLLVMSDGRSVYTPLFSGVSWAAQEILLDDVERIEIVRGPGATLWGSNAVNGVINILSKPSEATQGVLLTLGGGTEQRAFGHFRYGGRVNDYLHFRVYGKYFEADDAADSTGAPARDGWHIGHGGFRMDWNWTPNHALTLLGDIYDGAAGQRYSQVDSLTPPYKHRFDLNDTFSGANMLGRWTGRLNQ